MTEERTIGPKVPIVNSPRMTSSANIAPAIGALKVAAIPAAAPHPTRFRIRFPETLKIWPRVEPMADPIWTMGPSLPTDPPVPMEIAEARDLTITTLFRISPLRMATASITSGTP